MTLMRSILTLTRLTLHEAMRRRILLAALLCGIAFLVLFGAGFHAILHKVEGRAAMTLLERRVMLNFLTLAGLERFGSPLPQRDGLVRLRVEDETVLPEIARWLVGRGVAIYEMRAARKSLEALFLEVMGDDQRPG